MPDFGNSTLFKGSNITVERLWFDFNHDEKLTLEQLSEVEKFVNDAIVSKAVVSFSELPKTQAKESGVSGNFWDKYPDIVKVYTIQDAKGKVWSREVCGGPHVENTECLYMYSVSPVVYVDYGFIADGNDYMLQNFLNPTK